jgi:hypothetical protein
MPEKIEIYAGGSEDRGVSFPTMFWDSLRPFPGRGRITLRLAVACTLIVLVAYTFRMPFQDLMPFFCFVYNKRGKSNHSRYCVVGPTGSHPSYRGGNLIYKSTGDRAEFRIPGIALEIFIGSDWRIRPAKVNARSGAVS